MKTTQLHIWLFLIIFLFTTCKKETNSYDGKAIQGTSKLKRVSLVSSVDSKVPLYIINEYEYNSSGLLIKVTLPRYVDNLISGLSGYNNYEYNMSWKNVIFNFLVYTKTKNKVNSLEMN